MKRLIVFYSRSGHNRQLANELANKFDADIEEIIDLKNRDGIIGWIIGGRDSMTKQLTKIKPIKKDPSKYDLIILVSPLWVGTAVPAVRQYITEHKDQLKNIAFTSVCGSSQPQASIHDIESLSGLKLTQTLYISDAEFKGDYHEKVDNFVKSFI